MSETPQATDQVGAPRRSSLLRSSVVMASGTLVSRITGLVRSVLLLAAIGSAAGGVAGAFQTANTLPNTVYNLLAAGVFDAILVPQIVRALKTRGGDAYVNKLITLAGTILFGVTFLAMVLSPLLVVITASGLSAEARRLAILFCLLCLPQIFFYGLYNLLGELLNARGIFGPYMWAPVVNNVIAIAGLGTFLALWGASPKVFQVEDFSGTQFWVLAGTTTLGVVLQALVLVIPIRRNRVDLALDFHFRGTSFGSASKVAGWTFATLGVSQIGVLSTTNLASQVEGWATAHAVDGLAGIAAYNTAFMIYMVPQSLISVTLATAIFTRLANAVTDRDDRAVARDYHMGVRLITMLSLVSAAILIAGAVPMMQMVLFNKADVSMAHTYAWVLVALMPGVASTGMVLMSQRVFFAYEDARPVFLMGIVPTLLQVVVSWSFFFLADPKWWVVGAALGETTCRLVQGFIAVIWVARRNRHVNPGMLIASYLRYFGAAALACAAGWLVLHLVGADTVVASSTLRFVLAFLRLCLVAVVALVVYVGVLRVVDPRGTTRIMSVVALRLHLPRGLRRALTGASDTDEVLAGDNGTTTSGAGGAMDRDEQDDRTDDAGVPRPPASPDSPDGETAQVPAGETRDAEQAEQTGWSMIGRSWSAADPTHTGEFPVVGGPRAVSSLPNFDDIVNPSVRSAGPTTPPPPPDSGTDAAVPRSGQVPFPVLHPLDSSVPPAGAGTTPADSLWDTTPEPWDASPTPEPVVSSSPTADEDVPASRDGHDAQAGPDPRDAEDEPQVPPSFPSFSERAAASGTTPAPSWSEIVADALTQEDVPTGENRPGTTGPAPSLLHSADAEGAPGQDTAAAEPPTPAADGVATPPASAVAAAGLGATLGAWGHRLVSSLRPKAPAPDTTAVHTSPDAAPVEASGPAPVEDTDTDPHPAPPATSIPAIHNPDDATGSTEPAWSPDRVWPPVAGPTDAIRHGGGEDLDVAEDTTPAPQTGGTPERGGVGGVGGAALPPTPPAGPGPATPSGAGEGNGSHIDPTRPALVFGLFLVVAGAVWSLSVLRGPVTDINLAQSLASAESAAQSSSQSGSAGPSASAPAAQATPSIQSATVYSWKDDGGDNEDSAINMIDGDPNTQWHSRWYDYNQFLDSQTVTILLKLKEPTTVKGLTLQMDPTTSGGDMVVRSVDPNTTNPREGTEITSTALSPTTTITFPEPIESGALSLSFRTMPTSVDGNPWAWIYEITVQ